MHLTLKCSPRSENISKDYAPVNVNPKSGGGGEGSGSKEWETLCSYVSNKTHPTQNQCTFLKLCHSDEKEDWLTDCEDWTQALLGQRQQPHNQMPDDPDGQDVKSQAFDQTPPPPGLHWYHRSTKLTSIPTQVRKNSINKKATILELLKGIKVSLSLLLSRSHSTFHDSYFVFKILGIHASRSTFQSRFTEGFLRFAGHKNGESRSHENKTCPPPRNRNHHVRGKSELTD